MVVRGGRGDRGPAGGVQQAADLLSLGVGPGEGGVAGRGRGQAVIDPASGVVRAGRRLDAAALEAIDGGAGRRPIVVGRGAPAASASRRARPAGLRPGRVRVRLLAQGRARTCQQPRALHIHPRHVAAAGPEHHEWYRHRSLPPC